MLKRSPHRSVLMSTPESEAVDERLSILEDEADINDWIEVMCGAAMVLLGLFHMFSPGDLVDADTMRWFAATVTAAGLVWIGHGLKDMVVKDMRRSMVMMDLSGSTEPDHGLIRDVLVNPEAYRDFLLDAYRQAWEDGVITEEEMEELRSFQNALRISAAEMEEIAEEAKGAAQSQE